MSALLEQRLQEIKKTKNSVITVDVEKIPVQMRQAHYQRQRNATAKVKELIPLYSQELLKVTTYILVLGEQAKTFAEIAKVKADCVTFNMDSFYESVMNKVSGKNYLGKAFGLTALEFVNHTLEMMAKESRLIMSFNSMKITPNMNQVIKTPDQFYHIVKNAINDQVGGAFIGAYAVSKVAEDAIKQDFSGNFFPLVLYSQDTTILPIEDDLKKAGKAVFTVQVGTQSKDSFFASVEEVNEENVMTALKKIKNSLKKKQGEKT